MGAGKHVDHQTTVRSFALLGLFVFSCLALLTPSVLAVEEITVRQGEVLTIVGDPGVRGPVASASATFAISEWGYFRETKLTSTRDPVFQDTIRVRALPGFYDLTIRLEVNEETISYQHVGVTVLPPDAPKPSVPAATPSTPAPTTSPPTAAPVAAPAVDAPKRVAEALIIPPIPDVVQGETFVFGVIMRGDGVYTVDIPRVPFGTIDAPQQTQTLRGESRIPILIHIAEDATPGTYTFPVFVGGERADARVRVIAYRTSTPPWWLYASIGIILILIALALLFFGNTNGGRGSNPPREPRNEGRPGSANNSDTQTNNDRLITYY